MVRIKQPTGANQPHSAAVTDIPSELRQRTLQAQTRRHFLGSCATGLGSMFLATGLARAASHVATADTRLNFTRDPAQPMAALAPQYAPKARRIIYLYMTGAPSQLELFEHKPVLTKFDGRDCPASFLAGKRFAFITGKPKLLASQYPFHQTGENGSWISDRLPYLERKIDDLCFIHSMHTDQFNHAPAQLLAQTGNARLGYPSIGSWVTYGLGTENQNLPGFIVLRSGGDQSDAGKALWGAGFMPSVYQGVQCRSQGAPVLYLNNPPRVSRQLRRRMLDTIDRIDQQTYKDFGNPETLTRIAQYEMAFRMQVSAGDAMDISRESQAVQALYGAKPGESSFANNCLIARRLAERGVRFIQLYHQGWDSHGQNAEMSLNYGFANRCRDVDQATAALLTDLKSTGLLEDTLVVWGSEFGRTSMRENRSGQPSVFVGRDHHPAAFTIWMAGGGVKSGFSYGETDELGYEVVKDKVHVHDLHATMLYLLGFDHRKLNYPYQGLEQKLTGVTPARVVADILA